MAWSNVIEAAHSMEANEKAIDNVQVMPCHLLPTSIDAFSDREARGHAPHQNVRSGHIHAVSHPRAINWDKADVRCATALCVCSGPRQCDYDGGGKAACDGQAVVYSTQDFVFCASIGVWHCHQANHPRRFRAGICYCVRAPPPRVVFDRWFTGRYRCNFSRNMKEPFFNLFFKMKGANQH